MPLFSSSTPFDGDVEKATSEMNTTEDWGIIMDICDKVGRTPNGARDCLKSIVKRLNHRIPHVAMQACTLLDAAVNNCGRPFHLEIASRDFVSEVRTLIGGKAHPKVAAQLKQMIKKWSEADFKSDPALDMIPTLYNGLVKEGVEFQGDGPSPKPPAATVACKDPNVVSSQQEEDDIAKAIALSLEEEEKKKSGGGKTSLYPSFSAPGTSGASYSSTAKQERRKVRALYDFEAAEDNELTFKAGEVISILDDSDTNWWKGSTWRGEGLFPANFCTADLSVDVEAEIAKEKKSVQFNEEVEVKEVEPVPEVVEIDENKIDECLNMLQNADPTGEVTPDQPEMLSLEEQCKAMGPLIDTELEKIDRKHMELMELNTKLMDSLQMYHNLMKELPGYGYGGVPKLPQQQGYMQPPPAMYNGGAMPPAPGAGGMMMHPPGALPPGALPPGAMAPPPSTMAGPAPPQQQAGAFSPPQVTSQQYTASPSSNGHPQSQPPPQYAMAPPATMYSSPPPMQAPPTSFTPPVQQQQQPLL